MTINRDNNRLSLQTVKEIICVPQFHTPIFPNTHLHLVIPQSLIVAGTSSLPILKTYVMFKYIIVLYMLIEVELSLYFLPLLEVKDKHSISPCTPF